MFVDWVPFYHNLQALVEPPPSQHPAAVYSSPTLYKWLPATDHSVAGWRLLRGGEAA
jgi:hypothetical protein